MSNPLSEDEKVGRAFLDYVFGAKGMATNWGHGVDQHLKGTPERFVKMLRELTTPGHFQFTVFESTADEMVVVKDIPFVSLCAHHIVPFMGYAHVAYIPAGQIAGLSKFARLVRWAAANLCVQEELTRTIANEIGSQLRPLGVGVIMQAEHLCMTIRGVQTPGTKTITSCMQGVFLDPTKSARQEFLSLLKE